jgi:hypothetical protein
MYLDIKNTIWERITFDNKEQMNDVVEKIKSGELESGSDVAEYLDKMGEILYETMTEITPEDNDGYSTLEVTDEINGFEDIYKNGKEN